MRARGYALLMVLMVLALIALGLGTVMYVVESNLTSTRRILGETRCFYALDSASTIASATVQALAATLPPQTDPLQAIADAEAAVCGIAGGCVGSPGLPVGLMPAGVTMTKFNIKLTPTTAFRIVSSGPFRDIVVRDSGMAVFIEGRDDGTGRDCHVLESFTTGTVSPFQFMVFASGDARMYARNGRSGVVPFYASGDLCLGANGSQTLNIARAAAGGFVQSAASPGSPCASPTGGAGVLEVLSTPFTAVDGINTVENATVLKLPIASAPDMQGDNSSDLLANRWLLDPVIASRDNQAVQQLRLADVADVRIIDGVWYVKKLGFPWPGMPVYSDHPGSVTPAPSSENAELLFSATSSIGLDDVKLVLESAGARASADAWPPKLFSHYETDGTGLSEGGEGGVIGYGPLARDGAGALVPGFYEGNRAGLATCGGAGGLRPWSFPGCASAANSNAPTASPPPNHRALAEGARSGFGDYNGQQNSGSAATRKRQTKILPINFDVAAFTRALASTGTGELGTYFRNRPFNGVVFITSTWSGQLTGLTSGAASAFSATLSPEQGAFPPGLAADATLVATAVTAPSPTAVMAAALVPGVQPDSGAFLPHNLCGTGASYAPGFLVAPCDGGPLAALAYGGSGRGGARPNAVRVHSGADLRAYQADPAGTGSPAAVATRGLSVVSNLPVYVYGDYNVRRRDPTGNFPRAMLAGDSITVLSDAWNDDVNSWGDIENALYGPPAASGSHALADNVPSNPSTTSASVLVRASLITGWTPSAQRPANQSVEDLVRNLEVHAAPIALRGAIFVAGTSVFRDDEQEVSGAFAQAPLDWKYDTSLVQPSLQPAGIPRFLIGVASTWKDTR